MTERPERDFSAVAEEAAERAVSNLFRALGIDITRREELLGLADTLRWARESYLQAASSRARATAWTMMLGGTLFGLLSSHMANWLLERVH